MRRCRPAALLGIPRPRRQGDRGHLLHPARPPAVQPDVTFWDGYYIRGGPGAPAGYTGIPAVAAGIINNSSQEFLAHQDDWANYICATQIDCTDGSQYPLAWVIGLYENLMGRQPQATESAYWVPLWNSTGRLQVAADFCNGPEFTSRVAAQVNAWGG